MKHAGIGRRVVLTGALANIAAGPVSAASVAVAVSGGRCVVPVSLDGRTARMVLDTGAERTVVTHEAALRMKLRRDLWVDTIMQGAGGVLERHPNVDVATGMIGGLRLSQFLPNGALSLAVTDLDLDGADGLLGGDVLRHTSLDLDIKQARLTLYRTDRPAPNAAAVPLQLWARDLLLAPVRLDGHDLTALLDTGASSTLLNARGLHRLGLTSPRSGGPTVAVTALGGRFAAHAGRFGALRIGPLNVVKPLLLMTSVPEAAFDMTLGLDVLGQCGFRLSYQSLTLWLHRLAG